MKYDYASSLILLSLRSVGAFTTNALSKYPTHTNSVTIQGFSVVRPADLMNMKISMISNNEKIPKSATSLRASTLLETSDTDTTAELMDGKPELLDYMDPAPSKPKTFLDDGFVFGLEGSGIERPKGKVASVVVEGDSLETTSYQVALVSVTMAAHAMFFAASFSEMLSANGDNVALTMAQAATVVFSSWLLADFGSGVLHWSVDNYGNGRTPIMGPIIAAFQGHHSAPWTITQREFCNNVNKLCIPFGIPTMLLINYISGPMTTMFFSTFCALEILSQEFHKWSHTTKREVPEWVNMLQDSGLSIGRKAHGLHHVAPYDGNYCIVSGFCNDALDKSGFFRRLEHIVYKLNGVESNAWKLDNELKERTLRGEYRIE